MKLTSLILFASVAAATVLKRQGSSSTNGTVQNPFANLPDLSGLGLCTNECQIVFQTQKNPPSDWSTTCTTTFASAVQTCLNCISTTIPPAVLTEDIKQSVSSVLKIYQNNCLITASTTEALTLPTALAPTGTQSGGNAVTTSSGAASSPSATKTSGAAVDLKVQTPAVALAAVLVGALAAL